MLQQQEVVNLINDLNHRQDSRSFSYALLTGFIALIIVMFGLTMLFSTSYATVGERFFHAQLRWAIISIAAMVGVIFVGYKRLGQWSHYMMGLLALLLIWALFSPEINGAHRWIVIPGVSMRFQPSELAKVTLSLFGAKIVADKLRCVPHFKQLKVFLLPGVAVFGILLLVAAGRDLGTTLLLCAAMLSLVWAAGIQKRLLLIVPFMIALLVFYLLFLDPERLSRVTSFMDPGNASQQAGDGYQLWNSLLALGSGGWFGVGFMESKMKQLYLPEAHTDFILAVVGEELGYIGLIGVITAYLLFGYFGFKIAFNSRSRFGMLLAQTITVLIVLQAAINIGVVSGGLPTKGISAPMISYGGSNLLMNMIMVGLLVSVGLENVPGLTDNWPGRKKNNDS